MKKVLLVCDRANWAYDSIAKALIKYNTRDLHLETFYIKGGDRLHESVEQYDWIIVLGWQNLRKLGRWCVKRPLSFLDPSQTLVGIHSHHSWDQRATLPDHFNNA